MPITSIDMASSYESLVKKVEVKAKVKEKPVAEVRPIPASFKPESVKELDIGRAIMVLREGAASDRAQTARLIGDMAFMKKIKIPEAILPLTVILKIDADPGVREEAAWALWKLGDVRAKDALLHALANDSYVTVQEKAARALGLLGVKEAVPLMVALLSLGRSIPARLRAALASSLGLLVDLQAAKVLLQATGDPEPSVRYEAVRSLGRYLFNFPEEIVERSFDTVIGHLNPLKERIADIRQAAVRALRLSNDPRAVEAVSRAAVNDPDAATRKLAIETLVCFDGANVEAALIDALEDPNWFVRKAAGRVLAESVKRGHVHDTPRLCEALQRMERMFPSGSREWRLAAEAFASL